MIYWNVFWKTFAQLATAVLGGALLLNWADESSYAANATIVGLGLLTAAVGGLVAAGWSYVKSPAESAVEKATRSLVQFLVAGLGVVAFNSVADLTSFPKLVVPLVIGAVLSFALTFFQNQGDVPAQV